MFRRIKQFCAFVFITCLVITLLTVISVRNEESYLKNCESLGISCEKGKVTQLITEIKEWGTRLWLQLSLALTEEKIPSVQ